MKQAFGGRTSAINRTIFVALSTIIALSANAGEWHSAGNSPMPPYNPKTPVHVVCEVTAIVSRGEKQYRVDHEVDLTPDRFAPPGAGTAAYTLANEPDPGMNGQWFSLRFTPGDGDSEDFLLTTGTEIKTANETIGSITSARAPRALGTITSRTESSLEKKSGPSTDAQIVVKCRIP